MWGLGMKWLRRRDGRNAATPPSGASGDSGNLDPDQIVALLRSADPDDRNSALIRLDAFSKGALPQGAVATFLRAATEHFPDVKPTYRPAAAELVKVLENHANEVDPQLITDVYGGLDGEARGWAMRVLSASNYPAAMSALAGLLRRTDELPAVRWPVLMSLEQRPRNADVLVGPLAEALSNNAFVRHAAGALLAYARLGELRGSADIVASAIATRAQDAIERAAQGSETSKDAQAEAGLYLDLLARTGSQFATPVLRAAVDNPNTWVAMWGAIGLERLGEGVSPEVRGRVASNAACRRALYVSLRELGRLDRYPAQFASQAALAEAEMVTWLLFPTELDSAPDEVELLKTVELPNGGDPSDLYVFRYRTHPPHWAAEKCWLIGVAGPFRRQDQPTPDSLGATFSRMETEDSKSLDEHIQSNLGTIADWRARRT